ncbi:MAG: M42 family metallopeptidase [Bacillota bacterium]
MLLERLSNACGVPGQEDQVRAVLRDALKEHVDEMWTDVMGNLIVRKGQGPVRVMLDAHMDEVGFLVGEITEDGFLLLKKIGGLDDRVLPGRAVWVTGQRIPGVIGAKAFHLTSGAERDRVIPLDEMYVDLGCRSRAEVEALGVEPGSPVYFACTFERFSDRVVKGKAFDDRVGCYVVARLLMGPVHPGLTLYGAFTVQEEVGLRGARVAAYYLNPDLAIAVDGTSSANVAGVKPMETGANMGEGPVLYPAEATNAGHQRIFEALARVAREQGLPLQYKRVAAGGTDAGGIAVQRDGIPACSLSVPCRYIHSAASLCDLGDVEATIKLIDRFLEGVGKGDFRP